MFEDTAFLLPRSVFTFITVALPPATLRVNLTPVLLPVWVTLPRQNWTRILLFATVGVIVTLIPVTSPNVLPLFWPDIDTVSDFSLVTNWRILPAVPYSNPLAEALTLSALPAVPIANLVSALAPLTMISPCVVVGDVACPFATNAQFACAVPPDDGLFPVEAVVQI